MTRRDGEGFPHEHSALSAIAFTEADYAALPHEHATARPRAERAWARRIGEAHGLTLASDRMDTNKVGLPWPGCGVYYLARYKDAEGSPAGVIAVTHPYPRLPLTDFGDHPVRVVQTFELLWDRRRNGEGYSKPVLLTRDDTQYPWNPSAKPTPGWLSVTYGQHRSRIFDRACLAYAEHFAAERGWVVSKPFDLGRIGALGGWSPATYFRSGSTGEPVAAVLHDMPEPGFQGDPLRYPKLGTVIEVVFDWRYPRGNFKAKLVRA